MNVIIVEDEYTAAERLKKMLQSIDNTLHIKAILSGIYDTIQYLNQNQSPDLIMLDIHLSDGTAFDLIRMKEIKSNVIFTTAYDDFVEKAYNNHAFDYLLKPVRRNELTASIKRLKDFNSNGSSSISNLTCENEEIFFIRFGSRYHIIKQSNIACIHFTQGLSIISDRQGKSLPSNLSLASFNSRIKKDSFCMVPNKLIVNIDAIRKIIPSDGLKHYWIHFDADSIDPILLSKKEFSIVKQWLDTQNYLVK